MAKTIYAVSRGEYSDYRIVALFSTEAKAQEYIAALKSKDQDFNEYNEIEQYELDPDTADRVQRGYTVWIVIMLKDGTVERAEEGGTDSYYAENAPKFRIWERTKAPAYQGRGIPDALDCNVWAKSQEQAVKIANEKRAQMIANGEWK